MADSNVSNVETWENFVGVNNVYDMGDVESKASIALQSQYATSPRIVNFSKVAHKTLDATKETNELFDYVLNPNTASGVFLDWWANRVGVSRTNTIDGVTYTFEDSFLRKLILFKCASNIGIVSASEINRLLTELLETPIAVQDNGDMTIRIVVNEAVDSDTLRLLRLFGVLLRPAGVLFNVEISYEAELGFYGQGLWTFNNGVFNPNPIDE